MKNKSTKTKSGRKPRSLRAPAELPPRPATLYKAFVDASGGRHDHYTIAIAHRKRRTERFVIDVIRGVAPPFDPMTVTREFAQLVKQYRISAVIGDNFAQEWRHPVGSSAGCGTPAPNKCGR